MTGTICKTMLQYQTHDNVIQCFIECIDQWFRTGTIVTESHPEQFHTAIDQQTKIGWRQLFMGKLARVWLEMYKSMKTTRVGKSQQVENYVWGRAVVETILKKSIVA